MQSKITKAFYFLAFLWISCSIEGSTSALPEHAVKLHWVPSGSICKGYYEEPAIIAAHQGALQKPSESETTITSNTPVFLQKNHGATFTGPIQVSQPGRFITADRANVYQNPQTGKISLLELTGNVHFYEPKKHLVSQRAQFNPEAKTGALENSYYRLYAKTPTGHQDATGEAKKIERPSDDILIIEDGTYSTCSPVNKTWELKAKKMVLNQKTEWGTAQKIKLYFKRKKIFSFPYFTFPISKKRKTGFLYPSMGYSDKQLGGFVSIPYYFNLAPNYDETFTITPSTHRALLLESQFRYLTRKSQGRFIIEMLPYDPAFKRFIHRAQPENFPGPDRSYIDAAIARLKNDHSTRAYLHFDNVSQLNANWKSDLQLNYVSDDYYFQDVSTRYSPQNTDQLLNRVSLQYIDPYWDIAGILQAYQTLHPVNQPLINNIYKRTPQLTANWERLDPKTNLEYRLQAEFVHFEFGAFGRHLFNPWDRQDAFPTGNRLHFAPGISWEKLFPSGFFKPGIQWDLTAYDLNRHLQNAPIFFLTRPFEQETQIRRSLPIASIDTGLYFDRRVSFNKHLYLQTLEPRLFYLYVPYKNQSNIPPFDTVLPPFRFSQLFRTNRFIGIDRISNANQLSLGLTSRLLDAIVGEEKAQLNLGQIFYFSAPRVFLDPQQYRPTFKPALTGLLNPHYSPFVQELIYHVNSQWDLKLNTVWNWNPSRSDRALLIEEHWAQQQRRLRAQTIKLWELKRWKPEALNNALIQFSYRPKQDAVINIGYEFINDINYYNVDRGNLNRLKLSTSYPINQHWNLLAGWYYNIRPGYTQNLLAGLEYNSCCWAIRMVFNQELISQGQVGARPKPKYSPQFYIQFQLKGLGNFGQTGTETFLKQNIPGYRNQFFGE